MDSFVSYLASLLSTSIPAVALLCSLSGVVIVYFARFGRVTPPCLICLSDTIIQMFVVYFLSASVLVLLSS